MNQHRQITIRDLAGHLGLSPATISSVLNGKAAERHIPEVTAARVRTAARELGYFPDLRARNIRRHGAVRPWVLAVVSAMEAPIDYVGDMIRGMERVVQSWPQPLPPIEYAVELYHAGRLAEMTALAEGTRFNGAIITNTFPADDEFLARTSLPMPVVLWGRDIAGYSSVRNSGESGSRAAEILVNAGAARLAVMRPAALSQATQLRFDSFLDAARRLTTAEPGVLIAETISEAAGQRAAAAYFRGRARKADGLFLLLDTLAPGAYQAIKASGRSIPDDLLVIGHDDRTIAQFLDPPLSSFQGTVAEMRREAIQLLLRSLAGEIQSPEQRIFHNVPVLRASTGSG